MAITIKKETLKNGTTTYKFVVNLGIPDGEIKPRIVTRRGFASTKDSYHDNYYPICCHS